MRIVVYGAGQEGMRALMQLGVRNVAAVVDAHKTGELLGVRIERLEDLDVSDKDKALFLITPRKYKREIADALRDAGFYHFLEWTPVRGGGTAKPLDAEGWGALYNEALLQELVSSLRSGHHSVWTEEMLKLTAEGDCVLEIGCGSGASTLALAMAGRRCAAVDYSEASLTLLDKAAGIVGCPVDSCVADAREPLPFDAESFDFVFQAGLLEHFEREERIRLLRLWKPLGKTMVSMIPNANSVPYRMGKAMQEAAGDWPYGMELPQPTMIPEFLEAGYQEVREHTVGLEAALTFLPEGHYMRAAFERWFREHDGDLFGQGYLICTIGTAAKIL